MTLQQPLISGIAIVDKFSFYLQFCLTILTWPAAVPADFALGPIEN